MVAASSARPRVHPLRTRRLAAEPGSPGRYFRNGLVMRHGVKFEYEHVNLAQLELPRLSGQFDVVVISFSSRVEAQHALDLSALLSPNSVKC